MNIYVHLYCGIILVKPDYITVIVVLFTIFLSFGLFYEVLDKQAIACSNHLKAHLGYKSCEKTLGTEDLVYGGTRTHKFTKFLSQTYIL